MSAQRSQPTTPGAHHPVKPPCPMRNVSEFAVADTPGTAWPEYAGTQSYFQARFAPIDTHDQPPQRHPQGRSQPQTPSQTPNHSQNQQQHQQQGGSNERGMPTALARGVVHGSGPTTATEQQATRYLTPQEAASEPTTTKQNENVDAGAGQMEMYPEGKVADAVQGTTQRRRQRRESMSVGVSGQGVMGMGPGGGGKGGRGASPAGLHGRGRGEVTLEKGEADLER